MSLAFGRQDERLTEPGASATAGYGALAALLAHVPVDAAAKHALLAQMTTAGRHYHTVVHLAELWARHRRHARAGGMAGPAETRLIACAIAYHDTIHQEGRRDNEALSAAFWLAASATAPIEDQDRRWVAQSIALSADHLAYGPAHVLPPPPLSERQDNAAMRQRARLWFLDIDLTPLAAPPDAFDANTRKLRDEMTGQSDAVFTLRNRAFFRRLLEAPAIYRSPVLAARYEARARANLTRALAS